MQTAALALTVILVIAIVGFAVWAKRNGKI